MSQVIENSTSLSSGGTVTNSLQNAKADSLSGVVTRASTNYNVDIDWKDGNGNVIQTESIASGAGGGSQTTFDVPARSAYADLKVSDDGSSSGAVNLVARLH